MWKLDTFFLNLEKMLETYKKKWNYNEFYIYKFCITFVGILNQNFE